MKNINVQEDTFEKMIEEVRKSQPETIIKPPSEEWLKCHEKNSYIRSDMTVEEFNNYYNSPVGDRPTDVLFIVIGDNDLDKAIFVYANDEFDAVYIAQKMMQCYWFNMIAQPIYGCFIDYAYTRKVYSISFQDQCKMNNFGYEENPIIE